MDDYTQEPIESGDFVDAGEVQKKSIVTNIIAIALALLISVGGFFAVMWYLGIGENSDPAQQQQYSDRIEESELPKTESQEDAFIVARHYISSDEYTFASTQEIKKFIAANDPRTNPDVEMGNFEIFKAVLRLNSNYDKLPTEEHFQEIFYGEPDLFSSAVAPVDAEPSQAEASLVNLYQFAIDNFGGGAEFELNYANDLINNNPDIYMPLAEYCRETVKDTLGFDELCEPPVEEMFTPEQQQRYRQIFAVTEERIANAEPYLEALIEEARWLDLARIYNKRTRLLHKASYFGVVTLEETYQSALDTVEFANNAGRAHEQVNAYFEIALFVSLTRPYFEDPDAIIVENMSLIYEPGAPLYEGTNLLADKARATYMAIESGDYTQRHHMTMLGLTSLAKGDPAFKDFLAYAADFDYESEALKPYFE